MIPLRLVLDTNILVSAALKPVGLQRTTLLLATTKPARLYLSDAILTEYQLVLARPELKIRRGLRQQLLQLIRRQGHIVVPRRVVRAAADPDDDKFLECAEAARADYRITGTIRHFPTYWRATKIMDALLAAPGNSSGCEPTHRRVPALIIHLFTLRA